MKIVLKEIDDTNTSLMAYQYIDDTIILRCDIVDYNITFGDLIKYIDRSILEYCLLNKIDINNLIIKKAFGAYND